MLSDEEREALEILELYFGENSALNITKYVNIVLNLINKQSKEIERINEILIWKQKHEEQLQKEIEELKKKPMFLIKDIYSPKLKEISLQDVEGLIEQGREEVKDKIKAKIEELEKEQEDNRKVLYNAVNNLFFKEIDKIHNKICVNMSIRDILRSLLEKE